MCEGRGGGSVQAQPHKGAVIDVQTVGRFVEKIHHCAEFFWGQAEGRHLRQRTGGKGRGDEMGGAWIGAWI